MTQNISDAVISQLSELISSQLGLFYPKDRYRDLMRNLESISQELGFKDPTLCINALLSSRLTKVQRDMLVKHLTIGETYFFRNSSLFQALRDKILPELIHSRRESKGRITLWSAGSCTGEEPYSIAMVVDQIIPAWEDWEITILASDINNEFLKKAGQGAYSGWSFRNAPEWIKKRYFKERGKNSFEILPHIKDMVQFYQLNLAEKDYSAVLNNTRAIDVIFCRNVLMYFSAKLRAQIIDHFCRMLAKGGWLVVSPTEVPFVDHPSLSPVQFQGATLYRKGPSEPKGLALSSAARAKTEKQDRRPLATPVKTVHQRSSDLSSALGVKGKKEKKEKGKVEKDIKNIKPKEGEPEQDMYQEALALYEKGCYEELAKSFVDLLSHGQKADNGQPLDSKSMALLAKAYANIGKLDKAKWWCVEAINAEKLNPEYYYLLANIYQEQGHSEESIKSFKQAIYIDQDFVLAHFALGNLTQRQGNLKESKKHIKNAVAILRSMDPESILPCSEGIKAGRLLDIVQQMIKGGRLS